MISVGAAADAVVVVAAKERTRTRAAIWESLCGVVGPEAN